MLKRSCGVICKIVLSFWESLKYFLVISYYMYVSIVNYDVSVKEMYYFWGGWKYICEVLCYRLDIRLDW